MAHPAYAVNGLLTPARLEQLILLFDVFEGINGCRNPHINLGWRTLLGRLTPERVERLRVRHGIEPFSSDPWVKGFTGGSDDHAGLFVGQTWTEVEADTPAAFLDGIRRRRSAAAGRHNDFRTLAFTIYRIATDFARQNGKTLGPGLLSEIHDRLFQAVPLGVTGRFRLRRWQKQVEEAVGDNRAVRAFFDYLRSVPTRDVEQRFRETFGHLADMMDEFFRFVMESVERHLHEGNLFKIVRDASSVLPGAFLAAPFFSSFRHMFQGCRLMEDANIGVCGDLPEKPRRVLWFTDSLNDLNGVSECVRGIAREASARGYDLTVAAVPTRRTAEAEAPDPFPVLPLTGIAEFRLPVYESLSIRVPSFLRSLEAVYEHDPEAIVLSTPGPVGLLDLLLARLLNVPVAGVYHTDFSAQVRAITGDESLASLVSDVGGPREVLEDGVTGWVVPGGDHEAWLAALERAVDLRRRLPARWDAMSRAARQRVLALYSWDHALNELLGRKTAAGLPPDPVPAAFPAPRQARPEAVALGVQ